MFYCETKPTQDSDEYSHKDTEFGGDALDNGGTWDFDNDDQTTVIDEGTYGGQHTLPTHYEVLDM